MSVEGLLAAELGVRTGTSSEASLELCLQADFRDHPRSLATHPWVRITPEGLFPIHSWAGQIAGRPLLTTST